MWSGGVGSGSILEKIVGDGRCDWSSSILQEGMIWVWEWKLGSVSFGLGYIKGGVHALSYSFQR